MLRTLPLAAFLTLALLLGACAGPTRVATLPAPAEPVSAAGLHAVIPVPATIELSAADTFFVTSATQIVVDAGDEEARRIAQMLAELVGNTVETTPAVVEAGAEGAGPHLRFTRQNAPAALGAEGYALAIARSGVTLTAATPAGLFYGMQTLRQLLPPYVEYGAAYLRPLWMPAGRIDDAPRFAWRGAMLDVARHFFPPEDVKRYLDLMALYKLNRLHLHLSDDQGWRIEIPRRPRLTTHGASTQVGGGEGGYYTTAEYRDLVRYAEERFITIVPEIDLPGHTNAALASYPELNCDGVAPELFTGVKVGFSFVCVEKEETYAFIDDVVREIAALTPGAYFHLGGDEVHKLTAAQYAAFMTRTQQIVARHGKRVVGWDEIAEASLERLPGTIIQVWRPGTPKTAAAVAEAVAQGAQVVYSPADRVYLDMKYHPGTILGLAWAGYSDVHDAYDWDPGTFIEGVPESAVVGVEAPLWSETIAAMADIEYLAFPRLAGVAEIGWSPAEARAWASYRLRLGAQAARWEALGVNFYRAPGVPWQPMGQ